MEEKSYYKWRSWSDKQTPERPLPDGRMILKISILDKVLSDEQETDHLNKRFEI